MMMNGIQGYHNVIKSTGDSAVYTPSTNIISTPLTDKYTIGDSIGRGKFAVVRKCVNNETGEVTAAKFIKKRRRGKSCREEILREVVMLEMALDHPRLVNLKEVYETQQELILITEYCAGGELFTECILEEKFGESDVRLLMSQILEGLVYLHEKNIVHLDLKPQNILLTEEFPKGSIKICDLGFACLVHTGEDIRDIIGTPDYVAPEVLNYDPLGLYTDMWSVGVLAYVMLTTCSPFAADDKQMTFCNITTVNLDFPDDLFSDISTAAVDFIKKLLLADPSERMTAEECLKHEWLAGIINPSTLPTSGSPVTVATEEEETPSDAPTSRTNCVVKSDSRDKIQNQTSEMSIGEYKDDDGCENISNIDQDEGNLTHRVIDELSQDSVEVGPGSTNGPADLNSEVLDKLGDRGNVAVHDIRSPVKDISSPDSELCLTDPKLEDQDSGMVITCDSKSGGSEWSRRSSTDLDLASNNDLDGGNTDLEDNTEMLSKSVLELEEANEDFVEEKFDHEPSKLEADANIENLNRKNMKSNKPSEDHSAMEHSDSSEALNISDTNVSVTVEPSIASDFPGMVENEVFRFGGNGFHGDHQLMDQSSPPQSRHSFGGFAKVNNSCHPVEAGQRNRSSVGHIDETIHGMQLTERHKRVISNELPESGAENCDVEVKYEYISVSKRVRSYEDLISPKSPKIPRSPRVQRHSKHHQHH